MGSRGADAGDGPGNDPVPALAGEHLDELLAELVPLVRGARVREAAPLPPRDLLLVLEPAAAGRHGAGRGTNGDADGPGPVRRLRLSAGANAARIHLQTGPVKAHQGPAGPFFRAVAARLPGDRIDGLERLPGERILVLRFGRARLVAELIGRHGNLCLLDSEGRTEAVLVPPKPSSPHAERLALGEPWRAPEGGGRPPRDVPPLAELLPDPPPSEKRSAALAPLSWRVESAVGARADALRREELARDLERRLKRRLELARARLEGLGRELENADEAERLQRDGELLLAQHARLGRGNASVVVTDTFAEASSAEPSSAEPGSAEPGSAEPGSAEPGSAEPSCAEPGAPSERTLALDPKLTARENAQRFFARAKKRRRSAERLPAEIGRQEGYVAGLADLLERASAPDADAGEIEAEALAGGYLPARQADDERRRKAPGPRLPYRSFVGIAGAEIRVGRSARDNDELSLRHCRGNDVWLHTADAPGSHVVLRTERGREPDPEDVLDAAHLAVHFSPLRGARRAEVTVARGKDVKKPRRAPAGLVTLSGGKGLSLRLEPERLERLLGGR